MPTKPKYNYDIKKIEALENNARANGKEPNLGAIYKQLGYCNTAAHAWKLRNWVGNITYKKKENRIYSYKDSGN